VISSFFEAFDSSQSISKDEGDKMLTLDSFYERIKQEHENDDLSTVPQDVQHPGLHESTRLRPYQQRGVKWLLKRELEAQELPSGYIKMVSKFNPDQIMYYNRCTKVNLKFCKSTG
jgi:SNF2 family DNA or RNA helicase